MKKSLSDLNQPLISSCSVYAFRLSDQGIPVFLTREEDGRETANFGEVIDPEDRDLSIFATAARSFHTKTGCLLSPLATGLKDILETFCKSDPFDFFVKNLPFLQKFYKVVFEDKAAVTDMIADELILFYPLEITDLSAANEAFRSSGSEFASQILRWRESHDLL